MSSVKKNSVSASVGACVFIVLNAPCFHAMPASAEVRANPTTHSGVEISLPVTNCYSPDTRFVTSATARIGRLHMRRLPCYGDCPVDEVILDRYGSSFYIGYAHVDSPGLWVCQISDTDFVALSDKLRAIDFLGFASTYSVPATDHPTIILTIGWGRGTKIIHNYGPCGPQPLLDLYASIAEVARRVPWRKVDDNVNRHGWAF